MRSPFSYVAEHLITTTFPIALGIIILLFTLRRWLTRREEEDK